MVIDSFKSGVTTVLSLWLAMHCRVEIMVDAVISSAVDGCIQKRESHQDAIRKEGEP